MFAGWLRRKVYVVRHLPGFIMHNVAHDTLCLNRSTKQFLTCWVELHVNVDDGMPDFIVHREICLKRPPLRNDAIYSQPVRLGVIQTMATKSACHYK